MARSRNIKPGFFTNDELAEIEPLGRLLFAGLWTIADREGRLEDRPRKIKVQVLPYDDCDVDKLLNKLAKGGFIIRYQVEGNNYIAITNWHKHQNPHVKEAASEIPAPDKHHTSTIQEQEKHENDPADSLNLIPDSLNLIPDSLNLIPDSLEEKPSPTPYEKIVNLYHLNCPSLPKIRTVTNKRRDIMRVRWKTYGDLTIYEELFKKAEASDFLSGRNGKWTGCNFDWLLNENNMIKVLEGNYDNKKNNHDPISSWAERRQRMKEGLLDD